MTDLFPSSTTRGFQHELKREAEEFKRSPAKWLKSERSSFSQFGVETQQAPDDSLLHSIGYIIWACSFYEEKLSRAVFWLECYKANAVVDLPGQATKCSGREGALNKLLQDADISAVLGSDGVAFIRLATKRVRKSLKYRDDLVHGHHLGGWSNVPAVFRVKGKKFLKGDTEFIEPSRRKTIRHANTVLASAAVLALIDHLFDYAMNG